MSVCRENRDDIKFKQRKNFFPFGKVIGYFCLPLNTHVSVSTCVQTAIVVLEAINQT